jgi:histidinol dehydrogenase
MLKTIEYKDFNDLDLNQSFDETIVSKVKSILDTVKKNKDQAVIDYTETFDGVSLSNLRVSQEEIESAWNNVRQELKEDLQKAYDNIVAYHTLQLPQDFTLNVDANSYVGQRISPISDVGIYVPGGTAAYPSTVLMNAAPAKIAGVKRIVMISPPQKDGKISDIILVAAKIAGVDEIYKVGGAQGIAALAYGTETIKRVYKIVGPGNIYVALAKREVFGICGIDMIAGPSEILVYADAFANPKFVAADLLSQAEHDVLARSILVTESRSLITKVSKEIERQVKYLERSDFMVESLKRNGKAVVTSSIEESIQVMNDIAPEHLELLCENPLDIIDDISNAGAIFIGPYSPEPLGDYMAGPNHTLPTSGTAKFSSALGVYDFIKRTSIISFEKNTLKQYKDSIMRIAETEGLTAHKNAVEVRFDD